MEHANYSVCESTPLLSVLCIVSPAKTTLAYVSYVSSSMIDYIEANVEEIIRTFPDLLVILAGDNCQ